IKADADKQLLKADIIVVAIGQAIESEHFAANGIETKWGRIVADMDTFVKDNDGVFAGGDCVTGPATAIRAIAAGKVAAANIDRYLGFDHKIGAGVDIPAPPLSPQPPCGRINLPERPAEERRHDFNLMEYPMTLQQAAQEAARCLRCDHFGFGALKGGRTWQW
ncbi:MAG: FAD-dependent oxidoreductase, partial [Clostridia bacterium]|nr:FAD-dependent oxidoreductase [Clostridia bacterium]